MRRQPTSTTLFAVPGILLGLLGNVAAGLLPVPPWLRGWIWGGVAVLAVLVLVVETRDRRRADRGDGGSATAAAVLAEAVREQWRAEEVQRRVHDPFPLLVTWRPAPAAMVDHPDNVTRTLPGDPAPALTLTGRIDQVAAFHAGIPSGRLVVFGPAGSGKTILAMRLVLDLLERRHREEDRVPVMFALGQWDPRTRPLRTWLAEQLAQNHPRLARQAAELVRADRILPVLDGFDEIDAALRATALRELNDTTTPMVLTTRPDEYFEAVAAAPRPVSWAAGIVLDELTVTDLEGYLPRTTAVAAGSRTGWAPVLAGLRADPAAAPVAEALRSPLMVALARIVYSDDRDRDPAELLDPAAFPRVDDVRRHLFAAFLPAVYTRQLYGRGATKPSGKPRWRHRRAQRYLGHLAASLDASGRRYLGWWHLGATVADGTSRALLAIAFGAVFGLLSRDVTVFVFTSLIGLLMSRFDLVRQLPMDTRATPRTALANHRRATLAGVAVAVLVYAPLAGALDVLISDDPFLPGALAGAVLPVALGLALTPWGRWLVLARLWLPLTGRLPWAVVAFLDDAYRRGVLRQTGAVYEFRHAQIQEFLVARHRADRHRRTLRRTARWAALDRATAFVDVPLGRALLVVTTATAGVCFLLEPERSLVLLTELFVVAVLVWAFGRPAFTAWRAKAQDHLHVVGDLVPAAMAEALLLPTALLLPPLLLNIFTRQDITFERPRIHAATVVELVVLVGLPVLMTWRWRAARGVSVPLLIVLLGAQYEVDPVIPAIALGCCTVAGLVAGWWSGTARLLGSTALATFHSGLPAVVVQLAARVLGTSSALAAGDGLAEVPDAWLGPVAIATPVLAVAFVFLALARHDTVAAVAGVTLFAGPSMLSLLLSGGDFPWPGPARWSPFVPAAVAVLALLVLPAGRWIRRVRAATLLTVAGIGTMAAATGTVFVLDLSWPQAVALIGTGVGLTGVGGVLLPGPHGRLLAVTCLLGSALLVPPPPPAGTGTGTAVLGALGALAGAVALVSRHRHPVVVAAAAYLALAVSTDLVARWAGRLGALDADAAPGRHLVVLAVPLLVVGVPAVAVALLGRGRAIAAGQAAGGVVVFAGLVAVVAVDLGEGWRVSTTLMRVLDPSIVPEVLPFLGGWAPGWALLAAAVLVMALALAGSVGRRDCPPVAVVTGLAVVVCVTMGLRMLDTTATRLIHTWTVVLTGVLGAATAATAAVLVRRSVRRPVEQASGLR